MSKYDVSPLYGEGNALIPQVQGRNQFGWLAPVLALMARESRWAVSLVQHNDVVVDQNFPLQLKARTPEEVLQQCRTAVLGQGDKTVANAVYPAAGADLTLSLVSTRVFGVRVRISDAPTSFKYGAVPIEFRDNATAVGRIWVIANRMPIDVVILGISDVAGKASIIPVTTPRVFLPGSANATYPAATESLSTFGFAETLNERDLGIVQ